MNTKRIILIVLFGIFAISSCKYECPSFDKSLLVWIPQNVGDEIQFTNQDNSDTLTFYVTQKSYTDSYKTERQNQESCSASAGLTANNDTLQYSIYFNKPYNADYIFEGEIKLNSNIAGVFSISFSDINNITKKIVINNNEYKAIIFENDTNTNDVEIYKIILAENYGLLQFYEKSGEVWTLIEK